MSNSRCSKCCRIATALFAIAVFATNNLGAQGLGDSRNDFQRNGFTLLGQSVALDRRGERVGAHQLLTAKGYLVLRLPDGSMGRISEVFYQTPDCTGRLFANANASHEKVPALPGMVFLPPDTTMPHFIPVGASAEVIKTTSQATLKAGRLTCAALATELPLYSAQENSVVTTGVGGNRIDWSAIRFPMPRLIKDDESAILTNFILHQSVEASKKVNWPADEGIECSRGCFLSYIDNAQCDSQCYVPECHYDGKDCVNEKVLTLAEEPRLCAPLCGVKDLGDGFCDPGCNVETCDFDRGDCDGINSHDFR